MRLIQRCSYSVDFSSTTRGALTGIIELAIQEGNCAAARILILSCLAIDLQKNNHRHVQTLEFTNLSNHSTSSVPIYTLRHAKMSRFTEIQVQDHDFGDNEGEDTEQHSDSDEQVSEEEDNVQ